MPRFRNRAEAAEAFRAGAISEEELDQEFDEFDELDLVMSASDFGTGAQTSTPLREEVDREANLRGLEETRAEELEKEQGLDPVAALRQASQEVTEQFGAEMFVQPEPEDIDDPVLFGLLPGSFEAAAQEARELFGAGRLAFSQRQFGEVEERPDLTERLIQSSLEAGALGPALELGSELQAMSPLNLAAQELGLGLTSTAEEAGRVVPRTDTDIAGLNSETKAGALLRGAVPFLNPFPLLAAFGQTVAFRGLAGLLGTTDEERELPFETRGRSFMTRFGLDVLGKVYASQGTGAEVQAAWRRTADLVADGVEDAGLLSPEEAASFREELNPQVSTLPLWAFGPTMGLWAVGGLASEVTGNPVYADWLQWRLEEDVDLSRFLGHAAEFLPWEGPALVLGKAAGLGRLVGAVTPAQFTREVLQSLPEGARTFRVGTEAFIAKMRNREVDVVEPIVNTMADLMRRGLLDFDELPDEMQDQLRVWGEQDGVDIRNAFDAASRGDDLLLPEASNLDELPDLSAPAPRAPRTTGEVLEDLDAWIEGGGGRVPSKAPVRDEVGQAFTMDGEPARPDLRVLEANEGNLVFTADQQGNPLLARVQGRQEGDWLVVPVGQTDAVRVADVARVAPSTVQEAELLMRGTRATVGRPARLGWELFNDVIPGGGVDDVLSDPNYKLLDGSGKAKPITGTLRDMLALMARRRNARDSIVYTRHAERPVARWSVPLTRRPGKARSERLGRIVDDRVYTSDFENRLIESDFVGKARLRKSTLQDLYSDDGTRVFGPTEQERARGIGGTLKGQRITLDDLFKRVDDPSRVHERVYSSTVFGQPYVSRPENLTQAQEYVLGLLADGYRGQARSRVRSDRMAILPGNVVVANTEKEIALKRRREVWQASGINGARMSTAIEEGQPLHPDDLVGWNMLSVRYGLEELAEGEVPTERMRAAIIENVSREAVGRSATAQWAWQSVRPLSEKIWQNLWKASTDKNTRNVINRFTAGFAKSIVDLDRIALPPRTRELFDKALRKVQQTGEEVRRDLQRINRKLKSEGSPVSVELALHDLLSTSDRPATVQELTYARFVQRRSNQLTTDSIIRHVAQMTPRLPEKIAIGFKSTNELERAAAVESWSQLVLRRQRQAVQDWVLSHSDEWQHNNLSPEIMRDLDDEMVELIYDEFMSGELVGPVMLKFLEDHGVKPRREAEAVVNYLLISRGRQAFQDAMQFMLAEKLAFLDKTANSDVLEAMSYMLSGKVDDLHHMPWSPAADQEARTTIQRLGLEGVALGGLDSLKRIDVPEVGTVAFPTTLNNLFEQAERLSRQSASSVLKKNPVFDKDTMGDFIAWNKNGALAGNILPNPAYAVGNTIGVLPIMLMTRGLGGTLTSLGASVRYAPLIAELIKRSARTRLTRGFVSAGQTAFGSLSRGFRAMTSALPPEARGMVTRGGDVWTLDQLERVIFENGVEATRFAQENAPRLLRDLERDTNTPRSVVRFMQDHADAMAEFANVGEFWARMGVFLDELENGADVGAAARAARETLYDYGTLTDFERQYLRAASIGYTFTRKNLGAFLRNAIDNPERVAFQVKFARDQPELWGQEEEEKALMRGRDYSRLIVGSLETTARSDRSGLDSRYGRTFVTTTPVLPIEALFIFSILQEVAEGDVLGAAETAFDAARQSTSPLASVPFELISQTTDIGSDIQNERNRMVPSFLMNNPFTASMMSVFGVQREPIDRPENFDLRNVRHAGQPEIWAIPEGSKMLPVWIAFKGISGIDRQIQTLEQTFLPILGEALRDGGAPEGFIEAVTPTEPAILADFEHDAYRFFGLGLRPQLLFREMINRLKAQEQFQIRRQQRQIQGRIGEPLDRPIPPAR